MFVKRILLSAVAAGWGAPLQAPPPPAPGGRHRRPRARPAPEPRPAGGPNSPL